MQKYGVREPKELIDRFSNDYLVQSENKNKNKNKNESKSKNKIEEEKWFPYQETKNKKNECNFLRISFCAMRYWLESTSTMENPKACFNLNEEQKSQTLNLNLNLYKNLVLPLKETHYQSLFKWPYCEELLQDINWQELKEEFGTWIKFPLLKPQQSRMQMDRNWLWSTALILPFKDQLAFKTKIPCDFFFHDFKLALSTFRFPLEEDVHFQQFSDLIQESIKKYGNNNDHATRLSRTQANKAFTMVQNSLKKQQKTKLKKRKQS